MSDLSKTTIRPGRDWSKLAREAMDGGCLSVREIAVFIADNTTDRRADAPSGNSFAPGYHEMIETWLAQKEFERG